MFQVSVELKEEQVAWDTASSETWDTGFYSFIFDYNGTNVAHVSKESRGKSLRQICERNGLEHCRSEEGAATLLDRFTRKASDGGGWVRYDSSNNKAVKPRPGQSSRPRTRTKATHLPIARGVPRAPRTL